MDASRAIKPLSRPRSTAGRKGKQGAVKGKQGEGERPDGEVELGEVQVGLPPPGSTTINRLAVVRSKAGCREERGVLGGGVGEEEEERESGVRVVVTSYTMAGRLRRSLMRPVGGWGMVIADEAHVLRTTRRMRECVEVSECGI